jgi:hypothetical protein
VLRFLGPDSDILRAYPRILPPWAISRSGASTLISCHGSAIFSGLASCPRDFDFVVSDFLRRLIGLDGTPDASSGFFSTIARFCAAGIFHAFSHVLVLLLVHALDAIQFMAPTRFNGNTNSTAGQSDRFYERRVRSITIRTMRMIPPIPIPP